MFVEGIGLLLSGNSGVASILGIPRKDGTNGIFPMIAPDEILMPYIVFSQVHRDDILVYAGVNLLQELRFQFSCYGPSYKTAKYLAKAVKNVLDGYVGVMSDADNTFVGQTMSIAEHDETESTFKATLYGTILDYSFWTNDGAAGSGPGPIPGPIPQPFMRWFPDGHTNVFNLPAVPPGLIQLFWNGMCLVAPDDYTLVGSKITMTQTPQAGDNLFAWY